MSQTEITKATIEVMQILLQRPDAPLFTPGELADKAFQYVEAAANRVKKYDDVVHQARMAAMKNYTMSIPTTKDDLLDSMKYAILQGRNRT